jgi:hypothetical protein
VALYPDGGKSRNRTGLGALILRAPDGGEMNTIEGFTRNISITGGCWVWNAGHSSAGYGKVRWRNRVMGAHRAAWEIFQGPIPTGLLVLHRCDNPPCVNPGHLFLGTQGDNVRDCAHKGRFYGRTHSPQRGEQNNAAKLTAEKVREIRSLYSAGGVIFRELGLKYGVTCSGIECVVNRKTWAFID